jgi:adenylylsulfate kinase
MRQFAEIYLVCPLNVCMDRESKRTEAFLAPREIYARALEGKALNVPGVGQPYEEPLAPELVLDTTTLSPIVCAERIVDLIGERFR